DCSKVSPPGASGAGPITGTMIAPSTAMIGLDSQLLRDPAPGWDAGLEIALAPPGGCTRLGDSRPSGPMGGERPCRPPGLDGGECHLYLLHPPGGMVTGDRLAIAITLADGARCLATTPAAGKIYRGNHSAVPQIQTVHCQVDGASCLEWLPQETILFDGA